MYILQHTDRDLKPENILFEKNDVNSAIKVIDFGRSKILRLNQKLAGLAGTVIELDTLICYRSTILLQRYCGN